MLYHIHSSQMTAKKPEHVPGTLPKKGEAFAPEPWGKGEVFPPEYRIQADTFRITECGDAMFYLTRNSGEYPIACVARGYFSIITVVGMSGTGIEPRPYGLV